MRSKNMMWFLGAGASVSAGIPTAGHMIWDFKRLVYSAERRVPMSHLRDLSNERLRQQLEEFAANHEGWPAPGAADEYARLFEAAYPAEEDRQRYITQHVEAATPSWGHIALAVLMKAGQLPMVWTTNFDTLVADAAANVFGRTSALTTVTPDAPQLADDAITDGRLPLEIKIHGDFRSRRLKNTTEELREQDARLRETLRVQCNRYGLVVAGYSGRDASVMEALTSALEQATPFPNGLFWLSRGEPSDEARALIEAAAKRGTEAFFVDAPQFDEVTADLLRLTSDIDTSPLDELASARARRSPAPVPVGKGRWPVVRTNALCLSVMPATCRFVECPSIGNTREVKEEVKATGSKVVATRTRNGVLAFGSDQDIREAFGRHTISALDLHTLRPWRSNEEGLIRDALMVALERSRPVRVIRRRDHDFIVPTDLHAEEFNAVRSIVKSTLGGTVPNTDLRWAEGAALRLERFADRTWLLVEPRPVVLSPGDLDGRKIAQTWVRERGARRYNATWNQLIEAWCALVVGDGELIDAFADGPGAAAKFKFRPVTAFSRRAS